MCQIDSVTSSGVTMYFKFNREKRRIGGKENPDVGKKICLVSSFSKLKHLLMSQIDRRTSSGVRGYYLTISEEQMFQI